VKRYEVRVGRRLYFSTDDPVVAMRLVDDYQDLGHEDAFACHSDSGLHLTRDNDGWVRCDKARKIDQPAKIRRRAKRATARSAARAKREQVDAYS
jgi:hypothetical protein